MLSRKFGSFRVIDTIGVGSSAKVFCGRDPSSGQMVAIKCANDEPAARAAMDREVEILRRLTDAGVEGVPRFVASGVTSGSIWCAMELISGPTLQEYLAAQRTSANHSLTETVDVTHRVAMSEGNTAQSPPPPPRSVPTHPALRYTLSGALELASKIATTLHEVHLQNVVHGDLSPANILLRRPDDPVLIDFSAGAAALQPGLFRELSGANRSLRGTPGYVAPEIIMGNDSGARCDVYSLGCILYELLTGTKLFAAPSVEELLYQHLRAAVKAPSQHTADLPDTVDALVLQMLERDPRHRVPHAWDVVVRIGEFLGPPKSADERAAVPLYRPGFAGRQSELETLERALLAARRGSGSLFIISGPSGIGKTRLSNEIAARGAQKGMLVAQTQCRPQRKGNGTVSPPGYEAFRQVIDLYLSAAGRDIALDTHLLEPLANHAPGLLHGMTSVEREEAVGIDTIAAANDALSRILVSLADPRGLLLQIDDIQWIDELSAAFLAERADTLTRSKVLMVVTERGEEASSLSKHIRRRAHALIKLGPLDPENIRAIAKDMLATETLPEGLLDMLILQAEGNPLFVAESLRAIAECGLLRWRSAHGWTLVTSTCTSSPMASSLLEMLQQRLARLSEQAYEIVQLAAILGHEFGLDALTTLCDSRITLTSVLEELVAGDILVRLPGQRLGFKHDKLREAAELTMSEASRRLMHERAARHIEANMDRWTDATAAAGCHWAGADQPARALPFLDKAARAAHGTYALQRADELYRMAIEQCHAMHDGQGETRLLLADLHEARGDVLVAQARHQSAQALYQEAHTLWPAEAPLAQARTLRKLALSLLTQHEYERAGAALKQAEEAFRRHGSAAGQHEWQELIQILIGRFEKLYFDQQLGNELDAIAAQVTQLVETYGSSQQRAAYCNLRTSHTLLRGRFGYVPKAIELARQGLRQSQGLSPRLIATAEFLLGWSLIPGSREQRLEARSHLERALAGARKAEQRTLVSRILAYHCIATRRLGLVEETQDLATQARLAAEDAQQEPYMGTALACLAWVDWKRESPQAATGFVHALELWKGPHPFPFQWLATLPLLAMASFEDDFETAARYVDHLLRTDQQALPSPLEDSMRTAQEVLTSGSPRSRSEALAYVVKLARDFDFL